MGNSPAKRQSKSQKVTLQQEKSQVVHEQINSIQQKQDLLVDLLKQDEIDSKYFNELNRIAEISKQQLARDDAPLNKTDLVAILFRLNPELVNDRDSIAQNYTTKDLTSAIRSIIYDLNPSQANSFLKIEQKRIPSPLVVVAPRQRKSPPKNNSLVIASKQETISFRNLTRK